MNEFLIHLFLVGLLCAGFVVVPFWGLRCLVRRTEHEPGIHHLFILYYIGTKKESIVTEEKMYVTLLSLVIFSFFSSLLIFLPFLFLFSYRANGLAKNDNRFDQGITQAQIGVSVATALFLLVSIVLAVFSFTAEQDERNLAQNDDGDGKSVLPYGLLRKAMMGVLGLTFVRAKHNRPFFFSSLSMLLLWY